MKRTENELKFFKNIIMTIKFRRLAVLLIIGIGITVLTSCVKERVSFKDPVDGDRSVVFTFGGKGTRAAPGHPVENDPVLHDAGVIPAGYSFGVYSDRKSVV